MQSLWQLEVTGKKGVVSHNSSLSQMADNHPIAHDFCGFFLFVLKEFYFFTNAAYVRRLESKSNKREENRGNYLVLEKQRENC